MIIGIDFDNTIVSWDRLFHEAALDRKLIPANLPVTKDEVRNYLRKTGKEPLWTELQGHVYGVLIKKAPLISGVKDFLLHCKEKKIPVYIISHKTKFPFIGEQHDLHKAADNWLKEQGFYDSHGIGLDRSCTFFELTKQEKLSRIKTLGCTHFIDDLPEFLLEPSFPQNVQRILFDPNNQYEDDIRYKHTQSWKQIKESLTAKETPDDEKAIASSLLSKISESNQFSISPVPGGANNRIYRIDSGSKQFLFKIYFTHPEDSRNRLGTEYSFLEFAWRHGIQAVPQPIAADPDKQAALYEFVEGRKLSSEEIKDDRIREALHLFKTLNHHKTAPEAQNLPTASEACFSINEHLSCVEKRISQLINAEIPDEDANNFVKKELSETWRRVTEQVKSKAESLGISLNQPIDSQTKCISPSDFGFHNALLGHTGALTFIDFEYAGWDDPAKLICDFFCQPAISVPIRYFDSFAQSIFEGYPNSKLEIERTHMLFPLYQIKWCCILLNHLVPVGEARRNFAALSKENSEQQKLNQLAKARKMLRNLSPKVKV